jgi:outer membrane protein TolC
MATRPGSVARKWACRFWICALASGARAEELSLENAIEVALRSNAKLAAARAQSEAASHEVRIGKAAFLPTLGAQYQYTKADGEVFFGRFLAPAGAASGGTDIGPNDDTHQVGVLLSEMLFTGGARTAEVAASRIRSQISAEDVREQEIGLAFEVKKAYLDAVLADKAKSVAEDAVERSDENEKAVRKRLAEKEALPVELLGSESGLAFDRQRLLVAGNSARFARIALNRLLDRDLDYALELSSQALEKEPEARYERDALLEAPRRNPAVARGKLRVALAAELVRKAQAAFYPKIGAAARFGYLSNQWIFEGWLYGGDVNVSIPFFQDLVAGRARVDQAEAERRSAKSALREITRALGAEVRAAVARFEELRQGIAVANQTLEYRRAKYDVVRTGYAEQVTTFSDVLDEQAAFAEADLARYQALYALQMAGADLERLLGRR